ncbi:Hypothetical predicted protein [Mytilus galloprovincialis]|uniref:ShKT domain-containing protein n=2 Tax=Mytilus galloprovincialis TaxID=29158 RepID=A0A8B6E2I7_MYTGA|nr:Hypothetical predicted protein [Mytilus galloprovincialis]
MNNSFGLWISFLVLIQISCMYGQPRRADGLGFIPRTPQNAKRNEQRLSAIQKIKYMKQTALWNSNNNNNMNNDQTGMNMLQNNMKANYNMNNGQTRMNSNYNMNNGQTGINSNYNNMNNGHTGMNSNYNDMNNGQAGINSNGGQMNLAHLNPEYVESMMDMPGGLRMLMNARMGNTGNNGVTIINTEMAEMGLMQNGMMGNNGGRRGRRGQQKMRLPMCQPLSECAERFIPPQCRAWRYDTMNSVMCRACPTNRCEGGAKEYFHKMYKYHPSRLMLKMLQ